jgi:hypothetical protein
MKLIFCQVGRRFTDFYGKLKVHYWAYRSPPKVPDQTQMSAVHILILTSTAASHNSSPPFVFPV